MFITRCTDRKLPTQALTGVLRMWGCDGLARAWHNAVGLTMFLLALFTVFSGILVFGYTDVAATLLMFALLILAILVAWLDLQPGTDAQYHYQAVPTGK